MNDSLSIENKAIIDMKEYDELRKAKKILDKINRKDRDLVLVRKTKTKYPYDSEELELLTGNSVINLLNKKIKKLEGDISSIKSHCEIVKEQKQRSGLIAITKGITKKLFSGIISVVISCFPIYFIVYKGLHPSAFLWTVITGVICIAFMSSTD